MAVLDKPVWLSKSAPEPTAVLKEPVVLFWSAALPIAVLATPVVLLMSGSSPKNVLARLRSHPSRQVARACGESANDMTKTNSKRKPFRKSWESGEYIKSVFLLPAVSCLAANPDQDQSAPGATKRPGPIQIFPVKLCAQDTVKVSSLIATTANHEFVTEALLPIPKTRLAVHRIGQYGVVHSCGRRQSNARPYTHQCCNTPKSNRQR